MTRRNRLSTLALALASTFAPRQRAPTGRRLAARRSTLVAFALASACASATALPTAPPTPRAAASFFPSDPAAAAGPLELYESWPKGTALDHAALRDAQDVWPEVLARATTRVDLAAFYVSNEPGQGPATAAPGSLERTLRALEAAAGRGVQVRVIADEKFESMAPENAESLRRLEAHQNIAVRRIDWKKLAGGVMHAKYFLVDGREACLGSQNFDWRSLEHIVELGVRVREPTVVRALSDVFETDWALAGPETGGGQRDPGLRAPIPQGGYGFPVTLGEGASRAQLTFVASPKAMLPDEAGWELPALVKLIDGARASVRVQVLTYKAGHGEAGELEAALLRAAARGAKVQLLASHWSKRKGTVEGLKRLAAGGAVQVRFFDTPEWSGGFIPYARTAHAKYLVVDGARAWVGTSNWEKGYFFESRNVGLVIDGGLLPRQLEAFFAGAFEGPLAEAVDPAKDYEPPRTR